MHGALVFHDEFARGSNGRLKCRNVGTKYHLWLPVAVSCRGSKNLLRHAHLCASVPALQIDIYILAHHPRLEGYLRCYNI